MLVEGVFINHWSKDTYLPSDDTLLILRSLSGGNGRFLDVGTGTGIIGIRAALLGYESVCTDADRQALLEAQGNAYDNGADVSFVECNLLQGIHGLFSVIAFNPPYLPEEGVPDRQLAGGPKGVEVAVEFMRQAAEHVTQEGEALVVLSSLGNTDMFLENCLNDWTIEAAGTLKIPFETLTLFRGRLRHSRR